MKPAIPRLAFVPAVLALLVLSLPPRPSAEPVTIDGIAATVNGEVITLLELEKAGQPLLQQRLGASPPREREKLKREILLPVLDQLVLKTIQLQRARELHISVSDQEVAGAVSRVRESNNLTEEMFERALAEQGLTGEAYRQQISDQILISKVIQREIRDKATVTPREIQEYYDAHKEEYYQPERIKVRHLLVRVREGAGSDGVQEARRKALAILQEHRDGADFSELVLRHSPETSAGGETVSGWFRRGEFLPELEEVAFALPVNQVSEPIRSQAGFHLIEVVARENASYLSPAAVQGSIEETLLKEKMDRHYQEWLAGLRSGAQIEILF